MPTIAELEAEYQRKLAAGLVKPPAAAAQPAASPSQASPAPGSFGTVPSTDVSRALRFGRAMETQAAAVKDFHQADAFVRSKAQQTPASPNLPTLTEMIEKARPDLEGMTPELDAVRRREAARRGRPEEIHNTGPFTPEGPLKYPMQALAAMLRPIDGAVVGALSAYQKRKPFGDSLTEVLAAMDPLGRFTPEGAETGRFTNPPRSAHELLPKSMQDDDSVGSALTGLALDIGLSPSSYLSAPTKVGRGVQLAGHTLPGSEALVSKVGGAPGRLLSRVTPQSVKEVGANAKDVLGGAFNRFHGIGKIEDPLVRDQMREAVMFGESARATQTADKARRVEELFSGVDLERQRAIRDFIEDPMSFDVDRAQRPLPWPARPRKGNGNALVHRANEQAAAAGRPQATPRQVDIATRAAVGEATPEELEEIFIGSGKSNGPSVMHGQTASPTAAPGVPDSKRYGPMPGQLFQFPQITREEQEVAAWIENMLRDAGAAQTQRGILGRVRQNYFPRERTKESLQMARGPEAHAEAVGQGPRPALRTSFGFQSRREEVDWINGMLEKAGLPAIPDTTSAVNQFWRRVPEQLRDELGGKLSQVEEAERFLDLPKEVVQRYMGKATKALNDYDTMQLVAGMKDSGGNMLARPYTRELRGGRVAEEFDVPQPKGYYDTGPGPAVMAAEPAPPGAPQLPRGKMGRKGERLATTGEVQPVPGRRALPGDAPQAAPGAFEGVSPFGGSRSEREILGYRVPENPSWRKHFEGLALPRKVADEIDRMGEPYWSTKGFGRLVDGLVRVGHKIQLPWKVAATSGSGFRFGLRNYYSQQMMNFQEYGARAGAPWVQHHSHVLGLLGDESVLPRVKPEVLGQKVTVGGQTYTYKELRDVAQQTGLWRTTVEAEQWAGQLPGSGSWSQSQPRHASASLEHKLGKAAETAHNVTKPINPFSKDFLPTKHAFGPFANFTERQGRMAAFLLELERGKPLVRAAQDAAATHVNYANFSSGFEKYGTLAYPFAKFGAGMLPNQIRWSFTQPGRAMLPERLFRAGESMVDEKDREAYDREPKSSLEHRTGARLVGWPFGEGGALKEPKVGAVTGEQRLPYTTLSPFPDTLLNALGAPARIAGAQDKSEQAATELLEDAFPVFKAPYEWASGRNVFTGEPMDFRQSQPAPRLVATLNEYYPGAAKKLFNAEYVTNKATGERYLATPGYVNMLVRYFPNVSAFDLATAFAGAKKPYDNDTAIMLRLLGLTQVLHDPLIPAGQKARENQKRAQQLRRTAESWMPAPEDDPAAR